MQNLPADPTPMRRWTSHTPGVVLDDETVERAAAALHDRSRVDPLVTPAYAELDDDEREKSRDGARAIPTLLDRLGYAVVPLADGDGSSLSPKERERAARLEHERWASHVTRAGYEYGAVRDDVALRHPDLVPWSELDEATRAKDRVRVRHIEELLGELGLGLRRIRP